MDDTTLETRAGLPEALLVLTQALPRGTWEAHPNFSPLTRFWLDRHVMFRDVMDRLQATSRGFLDDDRAAGSWARDTARYGQFLLSELHGHHTIEDRQYFPVLEGLDARLERGFALMDADHHALDGHMSDLADGANAALAAASGPDPKAAAGRLEAQLGGFAAFLDRHLTDEEDLIVPVILTYAPEIG